MQRIYFQITQKDGSTFPITLEDVLYMPDLYVNLFSMTRVLKNKTVDFKREKGTIALVYDKDHKILFDKIIEVGCGTLLGVETLCLNKRTYTSTSEVKKSYMNSWDIQMTLSLKQLQRILMLSMILHICHVRTVLVLKLRLKPFQKNLQCFSQKRNDKNYV
jgi:hypothetical protein